ncbi:zinc finger, CCHC-type containing protein [Tanacetum coccineum]
MRTRVVLVPNKKPKLECWKCGKTGHFKRDCRSGKKNNANAGGSGKGSKDQSQDQGFGYYNNGIIHETTAPYTPQQNGVAERKNRALKEMVNSMLSYSGLSEGFWGEAMAVVRLTDPKRKTLGEKGIDCIFVGYAEHSKAYRFYVIEPNDSVSINSIIESRDAIFDENRFSSIPRPKDIIPNVQESQMDDHTDDVPNEIPEPRRGKRAKKAKSYGSDFQLYLVEGSRDQVGSQYSYCYSIEEDPRTYNEAMQSRDAAFWKEAIDDEIGSIMENNTWVLSDLPPGCKPLGCKWIFKRKMKVDGTIDKFKARLVIQGFRQKEGIDYFDTYAPVARITTIRLLLALAAIHNLVIHQMDVKTAFLNGDLDEEVYMKQPEGFVMPGNEHKVCKLVKSLYGLKQAPKQWHQKFDEVVLSSGFHLNQSDKCVYSKFDNSGKGVIICLYVDDMLIFGTDQNQVDKTKKFLSSRFSMKDMGEADVVLGIKIKRENKGIVITQSHYIEKILKKFNREDCSPLEYSRAIGCLMYAMTSTRPDIAYVVGRLSRFTSNPSRQHWKAITRVFKYLRGTKDYGLSYVGYPLVLEGYSDASWINHVEDSSSTSGWVSCLGSMAAAGKESEWRSAEKRCNFLLDYVESGLCDDNTDAGIVGLDSALTPSALAKRRRAKCEDDDYICRGHILNGMSDSLFDVYTNVESAKELWDSLESKYMAEDSSNYSSLVQLGSHLCIEESLKAQDSDKGKGKEVGGPFVHMTEEGRNKHNKQNKVVKRATQMLVVRERGLRTNPKTKVDAIAWWIDSGATTHVCKDRCWFKTYEPVEDGSVLYMGDEHFAPIHGKGSVALEFSSGKTITLFNVLYVPKLRKNLVSGPVLNKCGYKQVYESDKYILSKSGVFVGFGYYNNGHVHYKRMLEISKDDLIPAINESSEKCTTCISTKITRKPFQSITRKSVILELIHSDLCDFHDTPSLGNKKYVITFIDDASRFCYVYLLHAKDDALDKFRIYKTEVELQQNDLIKTLRTDRGSEYYDPIFFQSVGIIHETTTPYTPQQNGVVERKNRALKEMVNSIAVVRLPGLKRKTLGKKGIDCIFVGYAEHSKAYRFYVIEPNESVSINSIIESKDVIFDENRFSLISRPKDIMPNLEESQRDDHSDDVPSEIPKPQKEAIDDVIGSIMEYNTWILSNLPPGCKPLGFRQKEGIDYFDTYAPVARITTIRLLLALAAIHNLIHLLKSGWVFLLEGEAVLWASKKQTCITGSTMEYEFVENCLCWLKKAEGAIYLNLIYEIPIWPKPIAPISIRCDSKPTMAKVYSQIYNGKSRHLGVRHSMVRELIRNGVITIEFVRTQHNLADHLTKGLARDLVNKSVIGMSLKSK